MKAIKVIEEELWTSRQRQASNLHEISYRGCFKAELPRFFINKYSKEGDLIYDPFAGRGTTGIEASLMGRDVMLNDINPLSKILSKPRFNIVSSDKIEKRIEEILKMSQVKTDVDLSMFFHPHTFEEILKFREYLECSGVDDWIRLLITNRLTGHSSGFLSVYTLPPNQAITAERQKKLNEKLGIAPDYRNIKSVILKKYKTLTSSLSLFEIDNLQKRKAEFLTKDASKTFEIKKDSIDLIITSPPFLDVIDYKSDNWLRLWFNKIEGSNLEISQIKNLTEWEQKMREVFIELKRIVKPNCYIAFEVGEVKNGKIKLEESVIKIANEIGLNPEVLFINTQNFTKTSNIWKVENNARGTNTNRIVLIKKVFT